METETRGVALPSCPFADVRPEGCICVALTAHKRISADYQARYCYSESHVRCRRFQRAVPEIPNDNGSRAVELMEDPRAVIAAALISVLLFLAIVATAFHGTWISWFESSDRGVATAQSVVGAISSQTSKNGNGAQVTVVPTSFSTAGSAVPVLIFTPTPLTASSPTATEPEPSSVGTATAVAEQTPPIGTIAAPSGSTSNLNNPASTGSTPSPTFSGQGVSTGYIAPISNSPVSIATASTPAVHTVQPGDTLSSVGAEYGVRAVLIALANNISHPDFIVPGEQLFIPTNDGHLPPEAPLAGIHLVVPGDTIFAIAQSFDVSTQTVMTFNGILVPDLIQPGTVIKIPKDASLASAGPQTTVTVQVGDTLFTIAQRFDVSVDSIVGTNHLPNRDSIRAGQLLIIPND